MGQPEGVRMWIGRTVRFRDKMTDQTREGTYRGVAFYGSDAIRGKHIVMVDGTRMYVADQDMYW